MSDIANLLIGFSNGLKPETTDDINRQTNQGQLIQQNAINLQAQAAQKKADIAALAKRAEVLNNLHTANDSNRAQAVMDAAAYAPDVIKGVQDSYNSMGDEAKAQHMQDSTTMLGYTSANKWDDAIQYQQRIIDADVAAGRPVDADKQFLSNLVAAKNGDDDAKNAAKSLSQFHTYGLAGPDKFAEAYPNLAKLPTDIAATQATTKKTDAETNIAIPAKAKADEAAARKDDADANGEIKAIENPASGDVDYYSNRKGPIQTGQSDQSQFGQFTDQLLGTETSASQADDVKNPLSSATGRSQATNSTWLETVKQNFPDIAKGKSDAQILALRGDPVFSKQAAKEIVKSKVGALTRMGLPVNKATAALAYKLGEGNAQKILNAPIDTPLEQVLDAKTMIANPQLKGQTVKSYSQGLVNQFGTDPIQIGDPTANGEQFLESLPRGVAAQVKAIADGDTPSPTSKMGTTPMGSRLMQQVKQYDPTFVASRYAAKQALGDQKTPEGKSLNAMNTLIGHLDEFAHLAEDRNAASGPIGNFIGNVASAPVGGRVSKIVSRMNDLRNTIAGERARVLGIDDASGRKDMGDLLSVNKDTKTLLGDIGQITQTAQDRVSSIFSQYQEQTGQKADANKFIYPSTQAKLQRIQKLANQREPNRGEISYLISNPNTAEQFNKTFGAGQAERYFKMSAH